MKKIITELNWFFDYYIAYFLTNGNKINRYHDHMSKKWGDRYTKKNRRNIP